MTNTSNGCGNFLYWILRSWKEWNGKWKKAKVVGKQMDLKEKRINWKEEVVGIGYEKYEEVIHT